MENKDKRKRVQNLLSFMGLVASVSNYDEDGELAALEEEKLVVEPHDFSDNSHTDSSN